ncbi:MAG TPA: hypothetical protein DER10_08980 [Elusimicrobia bacterium]|nr:MAG: hypothetical protein A2X33_07995 [Elusimicrobia bacterium GWA2_51_34]HAF95095.1 hypothetical protein [Elusimicrobiota bacterium]HCE98614.1 hypothetical protein [Elusimicrobiota bacterium]
MQAGRVCRNIFLEDDQMDCMDVVHRARFLSAYAVKVCGGIFFDDEKILCLRTISDRRISRDEAGFCGGKFLDSDKIECFRRFSN